MAVERRSAAGWPAEQRQSVRRLLNRLGLTEEVANRMPRDALVALVRERGVHLADRAQLEYVYGQGLQDPPPARSADGAQRAIPAPPAQRAATDRADVAVPPGDFRRAAVEAAREALRQADGEARQPPPRPWWWHFWPPNWRGEGS